MQNQAQNALTFGAQVNAAGGTVSQGGFGNSNRRDRQVYAYINLGLPREDGTEAKLDRGLRLFADDPAHVMLADMLQEEGGVERVRAALSITCNYNKPADQKAGFAI